MGCVNSQHAPESTAQKLGKAPSSPQATQELLRKLDTDGSGVRALLALHFESMYPDVHAIFFFCNFMPLQDHTAVCWVAASDFSIISRKDRTYDAEATVEFLGRGQPWL